MSCQEPYQEPLTGAALRAALAVLRDRPIRELPRPEQSTTLQRFASKHNGRKSAGLGKPAREAASKAAIAVHKAKTQPPRPARVASNLAPGAPIRYARKPPARKFDHDECVRLAKAGWTQAALARNYRVNVNTVIKLLRKRWPDRPPAANAAVGHAASIDDAAVIRAVASTASLADAGKLLGIHAETVRRRCIKLGVEPAKLREAGA